MAPFEAARTQLCLGERLRSVGRAHEAAPWLDAALSTFERLGADPWARRALAAFAPGQTEARSPVARANLSPLTPRELQVAVQIADGATNREAAGALFLSPKTVGAHLERVYRKLGIHRRAELVRLLAGLEARAGSHLSDPSRTDEPLTRIGT